MYRLNVSLNHDLITTVHGPLLKLTQILWYIWYKAWQMLGNPIKYWLVSVPALVKLSGTKVVQPVHLARGYLHMLSTTSVLGRSMLHMMIVYNRADDSNRVNY